MTRIIAPGGGSGNVHLARRERFAIQNAPSAVPPAMLEGKVLVAAALAREYGFTDINGSTPRPLTLADV